MSAAPGDGRGETRGGGAGLEEARRRFEEAADAFRRTSLAAIDAAANPRTDEMSLAEARHRATYALAAASLAYKAALRAARPGPAD